MPDEVIQKALNVCKAVDKLDDDQQAIIALIAHGMALQKEIDADKLRMEAAS